MSQEYWFRQKRYGLGAGMPTHWKGWLLVALWCAAVVPLAMLAATRPVAGFAGIAALTIPFVWICWRKTEGGWRWRWGD